MNYRPTLKSVAIDLPQKYYDNTVAPFKDIPNITKNWWRLWGIDGRYMVDSSAGEYCSLLAISAAKKAINKAGLIPEDIDLILGSTCTITGWSDENKDLIFPGIAGYLKGRLNCPDSTMAQEINQSCISFLVALQVAGDYIASGLYKNVLVCSAEAFSLMADFSLPSSTLFGDGAAAVVLGRSTDNDGLLSSHYKSISTHNEIATLQWREPAKISTTKRRWDGFKPYFSLQPNGPSIMQTFVPQNVPLVTQTALRKADLSIEEIDHFVFHQPSLLLIKMWALGLEIDQSCYTTTVERHACLSSVSIPLTLYYALKQNSIKAKDTIVIAGASIGWGFGAQVWKINQINY